MTIQLGTSKWQELSSFMQEILTEREEIPTERVKKISAADDRGSEGLRMSTGLRMRMLWGQLVRAMRSGEGRKRRGTRGIGYFFHAHKT